ncbi:uncharacterized protein LOC129600204 [Paramacrobiotus metropolitanus]|uniref:uncharacterized protein LOC129600204 n=1 Tax=Paramacrobiotus metropolitanus TaxID=2943436 RepID=UPI0024457F29|nr:uncharacterized protein LOC129600204 [Paramacrobiotus metropolitanus]
MEWKHGRAALVLNTEKSLLTPPPLNLLLLPILFFTVLQHQENPSVSETILSSKSSGSTKSLHSEGSHFIHGHHLSRKSIASATHVMAIGSRQWSRRIRNAGRIQDCVDWKSVVADFHQRYLSRATY